MAGDNSKGITPATLLSAIAVVIMAFAAVGTLMQAQFASVAKTQETSDTATKEREKLLLERIKTLEANAQNQAHEPVEKATFDAVTAAIDKREDLFQAEITDINRQIAAALIIIDSNSNGGDIKKTRPAPP